MAIRSPHRCQISEAHRNWAQDLRFEYAGESVRGVSGLDYTEVDLQNNARGEINLRPAEAGIPAPLAPFCPDPVIVATGKISRSTSNRAIMALIFRPRTPASRRFTISSWK